MKILTLCCTSNSKSVSLSVGPLVRPPISDLYVTRWYCKTTQATIICAVMWSYWRIAHDSTCSFFRVTSPRTSKWNIQRGNIGVGQEKMPIFVNTCTSSQAYLRKGTQ